MPSSSPLSSQTSLYQFYTPIASNDSPSPTSRVLQPSTQQNVPPRSRITVKRGLQLKDSSTSPAKKLKPSNSTQLPLPQIIPVRRHDPDTVPRSLIKRDLSGRRAGLTQCNTPRISLTAVTALHEARHYFSRLVDMHHVYSEQGMGTPPFAVQCCNSTSHSTCADISKLPHGRFG